MKQPRRVRYMTLFVMLALIAVAFAATNHNIRASIENLDKQESQGRIRLSAVQDEQYKLQSELSIVGTDAYIENQARTRYGYLKPGELRFVITNPEALYSNGDQAPQLQSVEGVDKP